MGFIKDLFFPNRYYKQFEIFGLTKDEAIELDKLDGNKDKKLNGQPLFDAVEEYKRDYDRNPWRDEDTESLFEYIKKQATMTKAFKRLDEVVVIDSKSDATEDAGENTPVKKKKPRRNKSIKNTVANLSSENITDELDNYYNNSDKGFLGFRYKDKKTLPQAIITDKKILDEQKIEYLTKINNALTERIVKLTGDTEHLSKLFDSALDKAISEKNADIFDEVVKKSIKILEQLETMDRKNKEKEGLGFRYGQSVYDDLVQTVEESGIVAEDVLGNGYFDHDAAQMIGNCWAHIGLNSMRQTEKGRQYINNLVVKTHDRASVYLPGAKRDGLPKPAGDGIYTYLKEDICDRVTDESAGDGDYTAFMMAITDYRRTKYGDYASSANGSFSDFNRIVFGQIPPDEEELTAKNDTEVVEKFNRLKELYEQQNGYIAVALDNDECVTAMVQKPNEKDLSNEELIQKHPYTIVEINDTGVVLQESNWPQNRIFVDTEKFMKNFGITYIKYPPNFPYNL